MFIYYFVARKRNLVRKKTKKKKLSKTLVLILLTTAFAIRCFYEESVSDPSEKSTRKHQLFVDAHLQKLLIEDLPAGSYKIPQIQRRHNILRKKIDSLYGKKHLFGFKVEDAQHPFSPFTVITSEFQDGDPTIVVFLSPLIRLFEEERGAGVTEADSERFFLIDYIHQLDHLALGHMLKEGEIHSQKKWTKNELAAWAQTCEFSIRPILETSGLRVAPRHSVYYNAWVASGRNVSSQKWKTFIEREYFREPK